MQAQRLTRIEQAAQIVSVNMVDRLRLASTCARIWNGILIAPRRIGC
jgi:hypothetical protein